MQRVSVPCSRSHSKFKVQDPVRLAAQLTFPMYIASPSFLRNFSGFSWYHIAWTPLLLKNLFFSHLKNCIPGQKGKLFLRIQGYQGFTFLPQAPRPLPLPRVVPETDSALHHLLGPQYYLHVVDTK